MQHISSKIIELLYERSEVTISDIAKSIGHDKNAIHRAIIKLEKKLGYIKRSSSIFGEHGHLQNVYSLTDAVINEKLLCDARRVKQKQNIKHSLDDVRITRYREGTAEYLYISKDEFVNGIRRNQDKMNYLDNAWHGEYRRIIE